MPYEGNTRMDWREQEHRCSYCGTAIFVRGLSEWELGADCYHTIVRCREYVRAALTECERRFQALRSACIHKWGTGELYCILCQRLSKPRRNIIAHKKDCPLNKP